MAPVARSSEWMRYATGRAAVASSAPTGTAVLATLATTEISCRSRSITGVPGDADVAAGRLYCPKQRHWRSMGMRAVVGHRRAQADCRHRGLWLRVVRIEGKQTMPLRMVATKIAHCACLLAGDRQARDNQWLRVDLAVHHRRRTVLPNA